MIQLVKTIQHITLEDEILDIDEDEANYFNEGMREQDYVNYKTKEWKDITTQELVDVYVDLMRVKLKHEFATKEDMRKYKNEFKNPISTMIISDFLGDNSQYLFELVEDYIEAQFLQGSYSKKIDEFNQPVALNVDGKQVVGYQKEREEF